MDGDDPPDEFQFSSKEGSPGQKKESKPKAEEQLKAKIKSEVDRNSQVNMKPTLARPPGSAWTDERPNRLKHCPGDGSRRDFAYSKDPERPRRSDETAGKRRQQGESPSCPNPSKLKGTRLLEESLVKERFGDPHPRS